MKVGILGSGDVAQSLGKGIAAIGHDVMLGTRQPDKQQLKDLATQSGIKISTNAQTAAFGELIILAIKGTATEEVLPGLQSDLAGKVVIDVTNPLVFGDNSAPGLSVGHTDSGGEVVQRLLPDSKVVKTLNTISHAHMVQPSYQQGTPTMFMAGNDADAKSQVDKLLQALGWQDITDLGGIENSRLTEPLCLLWVQYGAVNNTWDHAFAVLKK